MFSKSPGRNWARRPGLGPAPKAVVSRSHRSQRLPGAEPSELWDERPECSGSRSSSDCTFGCILLRIKFCMLNYKEHFFALFSVHERTNRTEHLGDVRFVKA